MAAELTIRQTLWVTPRINSFVSAGAKFDSLRKFLRYFSAITVFVLVLVTAIATTIAYESYRDYSLLIDQQVAGGYLKSRAGLYAAPRILEIGSQLSSGQLVESLQRSGYAKNQASNIWNGSFMLEGDVVKIFPRKGTDQHRWISVKFDPQGYVASLSADDQVGLSAYALEPELLATNSSLKIGEQQTVTYEQLPPVLVHAILAIEDRRFFDHNGVDLKGIGRALFSWVMHGSGKYRQGGSTITQQLVKNTYLTPEKTLKRKYNEAILAIALENKLSKQDILALYCNEIYLGQRNGVGVRGVAQATKVFFGKDLKDITLDEAATIAAMIQSPARYAPDRHAETARIRRNLVIDAMVATGAVDEKTGVMAQSSPVQVAPIQTRGNEFAPYYIDAVNRIVESYEPRSEAASEQGMRIQTTIDHDLQTAAEDAMRHQLTRLNKLYEGKGLPQGAMVAMDPHTGEILAMVGGRSYVESQLNRATDAKRQPGSTFKPFVYATALERGISPLATYRDAPQTFTYGNASYAPSNYGNSYSMHDVLMREGLVRSLNVVSVDVAMQVGLFNVANTAANFGLPRPQSYPSMALGTNEVTPLQLAAAYSVFVNGGKTVQPTMIIGVTDNEGNFAPKRPVDSRRVIKATTAYMITDMLSNAIQRGTARRARADFKGVAVAGKTGTSRDGWFVGYTPNLVCVVWVGFDDNEQLKLTGAEAALPAWIEFVKEAIAIRPSLGGDSFVKPAGIVTVTIDPETGYLAGPNCPTREVVSTSSSFAPQIECFKHRPIYPDVTEQDLNYDEKTQANLTAIDSPAVTVAEPSLTQNRHDSASEPRINSTSTTRIRAAGVSSDSTGQPVLTSKP